MGFSSNSSHGSNSYQSQPINLTPDIYQGMTNPVAFGLSNYIWGAGPSGSQGAQGQNFSPYTGAAGNFNDVNNNPLVAQMTGQQQGTLAQANALNYWQTPDNAWPRGSGANANAFANSNPLGYANAVTQNYQGPTAANIQGTAAPYVNAAANVANNNFTPAQQNAQYGAQIGNTIPQDVSPFAYAQANVANSYLNPAYGTAYNMLNPNYAASLAGSPQTAYAVQSAINPLINTFNTQTIPGITGGFTQAGQRTAGPGGQGSSAYDIARANALTGLESNIGSVSGNIVNNAYQTGLAQQGNAINQVGNLAGQQAGIYNQAGGLNMAALQGAANTNLQSAQTQGNLASQQAGIYNQGAQNLTSAGTAQAGALNQLAQTSGALQSEQIQNLINAGTGSQGILSSQLNNTINTLNANALPQLTQQYGINQGLQLYQTQVSQLMTALGLAGQLTEPVIGNVSKGSGSNSSKGGGVSGLNFLSSARYKHSIIGLNDPVEGLMQLRPVTYSYNGSEERIHGFIAEEVAEVLPSIVAFDELGRPDSINYIHFPALLVAALQRLATRVEALETR
jgi:hypothetical protein